MDFRIPQEAVDSIAKHINDRNNKSYDISVVGNANNIRNASFFWINMKEIDL